jgi:hypothetical protein
MEVSDASNDELKSLREQFTQSDGVSLHDGDNECMSTPKRGEHIKGRFKSVSPRHTCTKDREERYKGNG